MSPLTLAVTKAVGPHVIAVCDVADYRSSYAQQTDCLMIHRASTKRGSYTLLLIYAGGVH